MAQTFHANRPDHMQAIGERRWPAILSAPAGCKVVL
jgi:hypothetical protein